jgi:hypothetical protein
LLPEQIESSGDRVVAPTPRDFLKRIRVAQRVCQAFHCVCSANHLFEGSRKSGPFL